MTTILPRHATPLEQAVDALAHDRLLGDGSALHANLVRDARNITGGAAEVPAAVLPWLAWGLNSFAWADGNSDPANRAAVAEGLTSNARKGSIGQVEGGVVDILADYIATNPGTFVALVEQTDAENYDGVRTHAGQDLDFVYDGAEPYGANASAWYHFTIEVLYPNGAPSPQPTHDAALQAFLAKSIPVRCRFDIIYQENTT
ncbi:MAG: hypothetical protein K0U36_04950 [Alphaproteobacteria bacterium]|nr:hypothetical protein [Alphaproteobacteria bacterium]